GFRPDMFLSRTFKRHHGQSYVPVALVGLLGIFATLTMFSRVGDLERQRQRDAFSEAARDRLLVIQREVAAALGVVQDVGGFFDVSRQVSRRQFREFVGPSLKRNREVQALAWAPRVNEDERQDFVSRAQRGFRPFSVTERSADGTLGPVMPRSVHFPVLYVQPYVNNKGLLGLDLASEGARLAMMEDAARVRSPRVSLPEPVSTESGGQSRFSVYLPVYDRAVEEATESAEEPVDPDVEPATKRLRGFAIGLFLVPELVEKALGNLGPSGVDIRFFRSPEARLEQLFYVHFSRMRTGSQASARSIEDVGALEFRGEVEVGDRRWTLLCSSVPGFFEKDSWSGYLILGGGVALTLLSVVFLLMSRGRAEQVRRLVAQRTLELERSNRALNKEIAERRRAEEALQLLNVTLEHRVARRTAEAERRARDLEQFAYVASHDLKAPLRAVGNLAGWLKDDLQGKLTAETSEQIELLRDRVARMHALVEGLLEHSRIGRSPGSVEEVDTGVLVADTIDSLAPPRGFEVAVQPDMPVLYTDKLQLGQVFANLIGNAINHHDRKKGIIQVSGEDLGDRCQFAVKDDGPGIPAEYQNKVFLMFQTLTVKDFGGHTGIGLALVKKLVEEHGGIIVLESGPERGSRFRFTWSKHEPAVDEGREKETVRV
ncbi:MAG: CHASE domain-containing protein, partial [Chromatiaceae bacterium]|nr:CHASE domain-containing protein [Chromatiaceae bacterium]